jgi:hypothetical protein
MKKSTWFLAATAAAVVALSAGTVLAAGSQFSAPLSASAFLNNGTVVVNVSVLDGNMDCGTLNYTAALPFPAGSACPSGAPISTAHASVTGNAGLTPFYITLTDGFASAPNRVTLLDAATGTKTFALDLAVTVDGGPYTTGSYYSPGGAVSDIIVTPTTHDVASAQSPGRYTGSVTFFLSF